MSNTSTVKHYATDVLEAFYKSSARVALCFFSDKRSNHNLFLYSSDFFSLM